MLINVDITDKHFGDKVLYSDLQFSLDKNEKVGVIGRNGAGKSTLFAMLAGDDTEFDGEIQKARGTIIVSTRQEHHGLLETPVIDYILSELPNYTKLKHIIDTYPESMGTSQTKMNVYSDALEQFSSLGYYTIEDSVLQQLATYQIDEAKADGALGNLSGGQKRFVELVKIAHANADLALIDEPTNHMDYVAKDAFVKWLSGVSGLTILVITHDRDVLKHVDRIIDIRDGQAYSYKGNYDAYLKQNSTSTVSAIQSYEIAQATMENIRKQIVYARRMKAGASTAGGKKNPFVVMEERLTKELRKLEAANPKPNFWIDRESISQMHSKTAASYDKYKAKNIRIGSVATANRGAQLPIIDVHDLSLGYSEPLFRGVSFQLPEGGRIRLHGRNGAGKTTLIKSIVATAVGQKSDATSFAGYIDIRAKLTIGMYEQEIADKYFNLPLETALERLYLDQGLSITDQRIRQLMGDYLFDPIGDGKIPLSTLSGGQKARFQLIAMLSNNPQLLILDEPTNHLDLPSIEELENALHKYKGAIIFVSHDGYFVNGFEHETITIGKN